METKRSAVGAAAPWNEVVVDGVRLAYDDGGSGSAVVCLHAIGHGARDFAPLRQRLGSRHRLIAPDWPGQGNSGEDRYPAGASRYASLLEGFLEALGLDEVVLLGNSIGGATAIRVAAARPDLVRALVLANPGGLDRFDRVTPLATGLMARFFAAGARGARWYPPAFALLYRRLLRGGEAAAQRRRIAAAAVEAAPILAQAWRSFGTAEADVRHLAPKVACPVLFTWARNDPFNQLSRCRAGVERFGNARLEIFPGGHAAFLEHPDAFAASFDRFVAALPPARIEAIQRERATAT